MSSFFKVKYSRNTKMATTQILVKKNWNATIYFPSNITIEFSREFDKKNQPFC